MPDVTGFRLGSSVLLVLVLACAQTTQTTLTSIIDPPWGNTDLSRIAVFFESDDPDVRRSFEEAFGERAGIASVDFIASYRLSPPGRHLTQEELARVAREHRVDAFLFFTLEEAGESGPILPLGADIACSATLPIDACLMPPDWSGRRPTDRGGQQPMGIRTPQRLWTSYAVALVAPTNGEVFWKGDATSQGRNPATWEDLRNSLTDKTIEQLLEDGVISR